MLRRLPLIILLWFCTDLYFYQAIKTATDSASWIWLYWATDLVLMGGLAGVMSLPRGSQLQQTLITWVMGLTLLAFIPRLFSVPVLLVEDLSRLFRGFPPRLVWVSALTLTIATAIFLLVLFGITRGRHFYRLRRETISFPDLPPAFDGFTITQITDVHSGSFSDAAGVQKGLDMVNEQRSDVILFTGDLVNSRASEMDPWIKAFSGLKAPVGKFSILGNHDYGDYVQWESADAKRANLNRLKQIHSEIGFRLLLDESVTFKKTARRLHLSVWRIGVKAFSRNTAI